MQSDEIFFSKIVEHNNYTANIWCAFDVNENIVTRKFLPQIFVNKINVNYGMRGIIMSNVVHTFGIITFHHWKFSVLTH